MAKIATSGERFPFGGAREGRGGGTAIGWSGWSGGKAGSEERCFPPLAVLSLSLSLTFCQNGFRLHKMLEIEVSMLQNCLKKGK